jgi:hypothetical protein
LLRFVELDQVSSLGLLGHWWIVKKVLRDSSVAEVPVEELNVVTDEGSEDKAFRFQCREIGFDIPQHHASRVGLTRSWF